MTKPHDCDDFQEQAGPLFKLFRDKCAELNVVNDLVIKSDKKRRELHDVYRAAYDVYLEYNNGECQELTSRLSEVRSEIQALQAKLMDMVVLNMLDDSAGEKS